MVSFNVGVNEGDCQRFCVSISTEVSVNGKIKKFDENKIKSTLVNDQSLTDDSMIE